MAITSKEINLSQLDKELGSKGLIADFNDLQKKLIKPSANSNVTEEELEAAIAVHIAIDDNAENAKAKAALLNRLGITEAEAALFLG
jgi:hypothetical protein